MDATLNKNPTSGSSRFVISLAYQLLIIHQIKFIPSGKLPRTDETSKALQMINVLLGPAYHLGGRNRLSTSCTASSKPPIQDDKKLYPIENTVTKRNLIQTYPNCEHLISYVRDLDSSMEARQKDTLTYTTLTTAGACVSTDKKAHDITK